VRGSEIWTLRRTDESRMEEAELRFMRYVADYTIWDKERGDELRSQVRVSWARRYVEGRKTGWNI
jgi:hypothetical protein